MSILPFTGGIQNSQNGLLIMAALAAIYYLLRPSGATGNRWAVLKTIPVAAMALAAKDAGAPMALIAALGLSALGDFLLAHKGEKPFLAGLTAFLAAHIAYVWLFLGAAGSGAFILPAEIWRLAFAVLIVGHAAAMARLLLGAVCKSLRLPVLVYILAISAMGLSGALHASPKVFAGVVLFIVSDTLLAVERFLIPKNNDARKGWLKSAVWGSYVAAQMLILIGLAA